MKRFIPLDVFQSKSYAGLTLPAKYLYLGLCAIADNRDSVRYSVKHIVADIHPYDEVSDKEVEFIIGELVKNEVLRLEERDRVDYLVLSHAPSRSGRKSKVDAPVKTEKRKYVPSVDISFDRSNVILSGVTDRLKDQWKAKFGWTYSEIDHLLLKAANYLSGQKKEPKSLLRFLHNWMIPKDYSRPGGLNIIQTSAPKMSEAHSANIRGNFDSMQGFIGNSLNKTIIEPMFVEEALENPIAKISVKTASGSAVVTIDLSKSFSEVLAALRDV